MTECLSKSANSAKSADEVKAVGFVFAVAALYHFVEFADPSALRGPLLEVCRAAGVRGTLLLASEGINGTISGTPSAIDSVVAHVRRLPSCGHLDVKLSSARSLPFTRLKVRVRAEIVSMGVPGIHGARDAGVRVDAHEWNALVADPNTLVIDTRNHYEVALGSFPGAVDPQTKTFRDFPDWFRTFAASLDRVRSQKIAMFCTGGIRCEKATAFVKSLGFDDVVHLRGGILKYIEDVPPDDNQFGGECFLFDKRVAVGHGLFEGDYETCEPCGIPLSLNERQSPYYARGLHCPRCFGHQTDAQRNRFAERTRQRALAGERPSAARVAGGCEATDSSPSAPARRLALPKLFSFRRCPYAIRARIALALSGIAYEVCEVSLRAKPKALFDVSPKGTVPVLVLADGTVLEESLAIMQWSLAEGGCESRASLSSEAIALVAENDGPFKWNLDRYKYAHRFQGSNAEVHRAACLGFLERLELQLRRHAHLVGPLPSLADFAIYPFVRQFAAHDTAWFRSVPLPDVHRWIDVHQRSVLFQEVMRPKESAPR